MDGTGMTGQHAICDPQWSWYGGIRFLRVLGWLALGILVVTNVPLFVCMPLTADPAIYDLQAHVVLDGGVLYRDILEPNLPGVVWVHIVVRSLFGWSTAALRVFDLCVVAAIIGLLTHWVRRARPELAAAPPIAAFFLFAFYFSMSEWTHCQRDVWMLLPCLAALGLRFRQIERLAAATASHRQLASWALLEGALWATGFWIKPFVAIPALCCLAVSSVAANRRGRLVPDGLGVLCGGLLVGAVGSAWLIKTGAWPYFWEIAREWNPTYFETGRERWTWPRYLAHFQRFAPWSAVHVVAIPLAVRSVLTARRRVADESEIGDRGGRRVPLFSAFYLGWLFQALALQHLLDYIHVPALLLALTIAACHWPMQPAFRRLAWMGLSGGVVLIAVTSPVVQPKRLACWTRCFTEGGTPQMWSELQLVPAPDWKALQPVMAFLERQNIQDGELTTYNVFVVHLHRELGLSPSTRYVFLSVLAAIFPDRSHEIRQALEQSSQRFVVTSLLECGMNPEELKGGSWGKAPSLPPTFPREHLEQFPFNQRLVFRSGQYVVHEVVRPVNCLSTRFFPLATDARPEHRLPPAGSSPEANAAADEAISRRQQPEDDVDEQSHGGKFPMQPS